MPRPTDGIRWGRSSTRARARVIAVQAIVVCALMVIVFVTILRPDEENPLQSVQAPEGTEQTDDSPDDEEGSSEAGGENGGASNGDGMGGGNSGEGPDGQGAGGDGTGDGGSGENAPAEPETGTGTVIPPTIPPTGGPGIGGDGTDSPTGDQYSDTVARLIDRLYPPS